MLANSSPYYRHQVDVVQHPVAGYQLCRRQKAGLSLLVPGHSLCYTPQPRSFHAATMWLATSASLCAVVTYWLMVSLEYLWTVKTVHKRSITAITQYLVPARKMSMLKQLPLELQQVRSGPAALPCWRVECCQGMPCIPCIGCFCGGFKCYWKANPLVVRPWRRLGQPLGELGT